MGLSVSRADLEHASSTVRTGLDTVSGNSTELANQINSFVSDSVNVLKGAGYDCLRARLLMYEAACEKLNLLCQNAANNIINANNKMINETQGYDLNTDALPELKERVTQIERLISWYSELVVVDDSVPEAERQFKVRNKSMVAYYNDVLEIIKERVDLLERLESISSACAALLEPISADINNFAKIGTVEV